MLLHTSFWCTLCKELLGCLALMFQYFVGLELCNLVTTVRSLQKSRWTILSVLRVEPWGTLIEGYTRYNVWTDFLFILLPILQKLPSHEHFRVFVCELLVFVGMIIKVEFLMLHRERRWQMNFCFCWSPTQLGSMIFSHEETTFTLLFFVSLCLKWQSLTKLEN